MHQTNTQTDQKEKHNMRCGVCKSSSYIVNIMYTTLLLIVLFERAVAVEFSVETPKKARVIK